METNPANDQLPESPLGPPVKVTAKIDPLTIDEVREKLRELAHEVLSKLENEAPIPDQTLDKCIGNAHRLNISIQRVDCK